MSKSEFFFIFTNNQQPTTNMSIFTKIITGEIPSYKVAEDAHFIAFLDINPNAKGHTLVVPKKEENKIFDLSKDEYTKLMDFSYRVAKALEKTVVCKRIGMSVIGLEVPHVHVHLIPLNAMADIQFAQKIKLVNEEFVSLAKSISDNFE
jgi:histidine triad (HIT) family protein